MEQAVKNEQAVLKRKTFMMTVIVTLIMFYAAVPAYGIIRDLSAGEQVFVLRSDLPGATMKRPVLAFIDSIYKKCFPQQEVAVPVRQRIDLEGRVLYTDGTPFSGGLIELRSDPVYTRTDSQGYFLFVDVVEGEHTISVLDEAGNVLARCRITISRASGLADTALTRLPDGTFVFQVTARVEVLEITVFLQKGEDGRIIAVDRIVLGKAPAGAERPPDSTGPAAPDDPAGPVAPPSYPDNTPAPPGGGGGGGSSPAPFDFDVLDTKTASSYGAGGAVSSLDIFGPGKRIAPGMSGVYRFTVANTGNKYSTLYDITFTAADTLPDTHKIPMRFRLKADGAYVAGDETTWCSPAQLYQDNVVEGGRDVEYALEWNWPEGANDLDFAAYAGNPAYSYGIMIKVTAQAR